VTLVLSHSLALTLSLAHTHIHTRIIPRIIIVVGPSSEGLDHSAFHHVVVQHGAHRRSARSRQGAGCWRRRAHGHRRHARRRARAPRTGGARGGARGAVAHGLGGREDAALPLLKSNHVPQIGVDDRPLGPHLFEDRIRRELVRADQVGDGHGRGARDAAVAVHQHRAAGVERGGDEVSTRLEGALQAWEV